MQFRIAYWWEGQLYAEQQEIAAIIQMRQLLSTMVDNGKYSV